MPHCFTIAQPETLAGGSRPWSPGRREEDVDIQRAASSPDNGLVRWVLATTQERSVALFTRLGADAGLTTLPEWAQKHAAIVRRFGRYPHRNAILGRESMPDETAFLAQPGSRF
jgi:hypothetical protein